MTHQRLSGISHLPDVSVALCPFGRHKIFPSERILWNTPIRTERNIPVLALEVGGCVDHVGKDWNWARDSVVDAGHPSGERYFAHYAELLHRFNVWSIFNYSPQLVTFSPISWIEFLKPNSPNEISIFAFFKIHIHSSKNVEKWEKYFFSSENCWKWKITILLKLEMVENVNFM